MRRRIVSVASVKRIAEAFETEYERLFGPGSALRMPASSWSLRGRRHRHVDKPELVKRNGGMARHLVRDDDFLPIADAMIDTPDL